MEIQGYLDVLYIVLSITLPVLIILISIALYKVIKLLWHIENITKTISSLLEIANAVMIKPVQILTLILDFVWKALKK